MYVRSLVSTVRISVYQSVCFSYSSIFGKLFLLGIVALHIRMPFDKKKNTFIQLVYTQTCKKNGGILQQNLLRHGLVTEFVFRTT